MPNQEPYESMFTPQDATSPVSSVVAGTPNYNFPQPVAPREMNFGEGVGMALRTFGAGMQGQANPMDAYMERQRQQANTEFNQRMSLHNASIQERSANRLDEAANRKTTAQDRIRKAMDPDKFQKDPTRSMLEMLPDLIEVDPNAATSIFTLAQKTNADSGKKFAARIAGNIISQATDQKTGVIDAAKVTAGMAAIGDPDVMDAIKGFMPFITEQGREERFQQGEARRESAQAQQANQFQQTTARIMQSFAQAQAQQREMFDLNQKATADQRARLTPTETKPLRGNIQALNIIDAYQQSHSELMAETKGNLSAVMKGVLTKNANAKTMADIGGLTGNTDAERKFSAEYNAVTAGLKSLTEEVGVLTDQDAVRILQSFNPAVPSKQFDANLAARRKVHERNWQMTTDELRAQGKNTKGYDYEDRLIGVRVRDKVTGKPGTYKFGSGEKELPPNFERAQ